MILMSIFPDCINRPHMQGRSKCILSSNVHLQAKVYSLHVYVDGLRELKRCQIFQKQLLIFPFR